MERFAGWFAVLAGVVVAHGALAQVARSGGSANSQLLQQMQQLASERTTLQVENERLKTELAELKKDRDALKSAQAVVDRRIKESVAALEHSNVQREATDQELTQNRAKMQELIGKFRESLAKMREIETDDAAQKQALAARDHELSVCVDHNAALYHLNDEILTRMEKRQGFFSCMAGDEPFTKIKRVRLENLADDYRARASQQLVAPVAKPTASSAVSAATPSATPPPAPAEKADH